MPPLQSTGMKRKREMLDDEVSHGLQRQSILDISMIKLRTSPKRRIEPCLRRSVLILNTLKHIELELQNEGVNIHTSTEAAMNKIPEMSTTELTLDPLPDMSTFVTAQPVSMAMQLDTPVVVDAGNSGYFDKDVGIVDLLPCKPVLGCDGTSAPVSSQDFVSSSSEGAAPKLLQAGDSNNNSVALVPYSSSSAVAVDDPFSDIDITLDFDLMAWSSTLTSLPVTSSSSQTPSTSGVTPTITPLSPTRPLPSLSVEDLLHSFPQSSWLEPDIPSSFSVSTSVSPVLNSQCSTYCRTDSSLDDLENIMQILVGL